MSVILPLNIDCLDRESILDIGLDDDVLGDELAVPVHARVLGPLGRHLPRLDLLHPGHKLLLEASIKAWLPLNKHNKINKCCIIISNMQNIRGLKEHFITLSSTDF